MTQWHVWLVWLVSAEYAAAAVGAWTAGKEPQAVMLAGYVVANLGLIWSLR
ncbi:MAG: hypothetical protein AB7N54_20115 [Alphaproteobacteria bacterium]